MFDPRQQRFMGGPGGQPMPMQRPGWAQQLGQGLAAQQPQWGQPMPQGGPPPGVRMGPPQGGMPPQAAGPDGRPMMPQGGGFLRDSDAAIRQALARRGQRMPVGGPQGLVAPPGAMPPQGAVPPQGGAEPDADERGGPPDGDHDDPRRMMQGGGYR